MNVLLYCTTSFSGGNGMVKKPLVDTISQIKFAHPSTYRIRGMNEKLRAGKSCVYLIALHCVLETTFVFVVVPLHAFDSSSVTNAYQDSTYKGPEATPHNKGMKHTSQQHHTYILLIKITH